MVETNVLDVLLDGTITRMKLETDSMAVTICRDKTDQNFRLEKIDVADQMHMEEVINALAEHLHEQCIYNIEVDCVDGSKATLKI